MRTTTSLLLVLVVALLVPRRATAAPGVLPPVPDSLRAAYQAASRPDAARLAVLLRIAYAYIEPLDSAGVLDYGAAAEQLARRLADSVGVGQAVDVRGHYYQQVSNQTLAQPLLERAERLLTDAPPQVRGTNYYHLGWVYDELSQATRALRYYRRAYALAVQVRDADLQSSVLNSWSSVYMYRQQYDSAQYYMLRALRLSHQSGERGAEAPLLCNLASILKMAGRPRAALPYARQAASLQQALGDSISLAASFNTLGNLAYLLDSLPQARRYFRAALAIGRRHRIEGALSMTYIGLADVFNKTGALDSAEYYHLAAIRQAERSHNVINLPDLMASLVRLYARQPRRVTDAAAWAARLQALPTTEGNQPILALEAQALVAEARHDYARALALHQQFDVLKTRALARNNEHLTQELRIRFDTERAEQQVELLKQARELETLRRQRQVGALVALAVGLLALIGGVVWWYRRRQQQREAALRHRLAADLHDDVGNMLTQISLQSSLLRESKNTPEQLLARLDRLASTSRQAAQQMNDVIWGLGEESQTLPQLLTRMRDHAYEMLAPTSIELDFQVDESLAGTELPAEVRQNLYLIFKEALHNAVKHAAGASRVQVRLSRAGGQVHLRVQDDGHGPAGEATRLGGNGLRNMQARAQALGGTVRFRSQPQGFAVLVDLPG